jgi:hypothetical protein
MGKTCNNCGTENLNVNVPYVVHESAMARCERHNKRLWVIILVLIGALIGTNLAWIIYNSQFEVVEENVTVEQENDNGDNNYIGNNGDITYGEAENNN